MQSNAEQCLASNTEQCKALHIVDQLEESSQVSPIEH